MAYNNNSGYNSYNYPGQWNPNSNLPPNYNQGQQAQRPPVQGQGNVPFRQPPPPQYQQQTGQQYQVPFRNDYQNVHPVPSSPQQQQPQQQQPQQQQPQQQQPQQQQYRAAPSPNMYYLPGQPQYNAASLAHGQPRMIYQPPRQQIPPYSPQQQAQYVQTQNQQMASMPQRQLSYAQPQQYQLPSPQPSQVSLPAGYRVSMSPVVPMQQFQPPPQSPVFQARNNSVLSQSIHSQPQSPMQGSRSNSIVSQSIPSQPQSPMQGPSTRKTVSPAIIHQAIPHPIQSRPISIPNDGGHSRTTPTQPSMLQMSYSPGNQTRNIPKNDMTVPVQQRPTSSTQPTMSRMENMQNQPAGNKQPVAAIQARRSETPLQPVHSNKASPQPNTTGLQQSTPMKPPTTLRQEDQPLPQTISSMADISLTAPKGQAVRQPEKQATQQVTKSIQHEPVKSLAQVNKLKELQEAKTAVPAKPRDEPPRQPITEIDYPLLLIDLSEEYFNAAYGKATQDQSARREPDLNIFYKLIATGLGCLEVVLKQWRSTLSPAVEAAVRLRYATILFEETDNVSTTEEVLSKGIAQCDKLRLLDFKYNMQHLLACVTFSTNPRAANKYLDTVIRDAEIQNHVPWSYAFRFLRVSLLLGSQQSQDASQALNHLKSILNQAKSRGDIAVAAAACAIEAMVHVNRATTIQAIEPAQLALTTVRSAENNPNVPRIPQLIIMAYFVDLICSLYRADSETSYKKMKAMHEAMDELANNHSWTADDTFLVPISQQSAKSIPSTTSSGAVVSRPSERTYIKLAWMPKNELYALGNMLGAETVMHKTSSDKKCEELFDNADAFLKVSEAQNPDYAHSKFHQDLVFHLHVLRVFSACSRNAWGEAKKLLNKLKVKLANTAETTPTSLSAFIIYLEGMIAQGTGDTKTALALYSNLTLSLSHSESSSFRPPILQDLSILATLNTILIIHQSSHPQHTQMPALLSSLENFESLHPSQNIRGAYFLLRALHSDTSSSTTNPILETKANLRQVLQIAKQTSNSQFSCITLTFMTDRFFAGQVGEQAHKSATTALNLARRAKNELWTSVAESLLADCLERRGSVAEAEKRRDEALMLAERLPATMQLAAVTSSEMDGKDRRMEDW